MRIGVMIGPERGRYSTKVDRLRRDARWAEDAGFSTIWIPQIPDEFDALTAATVIGAETARIEIGTAVVPVQPLDLRRVAPPLGADHHSDAHGWTSPSRPWPTVGSGDDATGLQIDDGVPVQADLLEDVVAVLVELRRTA